MVLLLFFDIKVVYKGGIGKCGCMDGGIVFCNEQFLFIVIGYIDQVFWEMFDGMFGYVLVFNILGCLVCVCWDDIGNDC